MYLTGLVLGAAWVSLLAGCMAILPTRHYSFSAPGLYLLAADGRTGPGADVRTVSVTTVVEVGTEAHDGRHHRFTPAPLLGGLGMVAMMALMMSGSNF